MASIKAQRLLIYGCNGYIGKLTSQYVASYPIFKGKVVLAGRSRRKVEDVARTLNLPYRVFDLTMAEVIDKNLEDIGVILNMAGPFYQTTRPIIESCLRTKTHYLDVAGESDIFHLLFETLESDIRNGGIIAVPGVGFGLVPTDCLATMLHDQLPTATHLDLSFSFSDLRRSITASPGSTKSDIHTLSTRGSTALPRINGILQPIPTFAKTRVVNFPNAGRAFVGFVPWAGCYTAYYSTLIQNIHTYVPVDPMDPLNPTPWSLLVLCLLLRYIPFLQWILFALIDRFATGPSEQERRGVRIDVWGEARDEKRGECVRGCLQTMEAHGFASIAALKAACTLLERDFNLGPGVYTPSKAFGVGFVLTIPHTNLYNFIRLQLPASASSYALSPATRKAYSEKTVQAAMLTIPP